MEKELLEETQLMKRMISSAIWALLTCCLLTSMTASAASQVHQRGKADAGKKDRPYENNLLEKSQSKKNEVERLGKVEQLTFSTVNDEDPSVIRGLDGTFYVVFWSKRSGVADIYMKTSKDGHKWTYPKIVISSPYTDLGPQLTQTQDGTFHLVWWRSKDEDWIRNVYYINSKDGMRWSKPRKITDEKTVNWAPLILSDDNDRVWIVWSSKKNRNQDIFLTYSDDNGRSWSDPIQLTDHQFDDDFPYMLQMRNGKYLLVWCRFNSKKGSFLSNNTSDIHYATSNDGITWSRPVLVTNDKDKSYLDILPMIYEAKNNYYIVWVTYNRLSRNKGEAVEVPLSNPNMENVAHFADGYSVRVVPAQGGKYIMFYVTDAVDKGGQKDIFFQFFQRTQ